MLKLGENDVKFDFGQAGNAVLVLLLRREIDELLASRIIDEKGSEVDKSYQKELRSVVLGLLGK